MPMPSALMRSGLLRVSVRPSRLSVKWLCARDASNLRSMKGAARFRAVLFDLDNTLYARCEIGRAMGDRIVTYIRSRIDPSELHPPPPKATTEKDLEKSYHHPPDISPSDDAVERVCLEYYEKYGLSLTGFLKHYPDRVSEDDYLRVVHEPSEPHLIGHYLPSPQTEFAEVRRLLHIMRHELGLHLFVFSNAPHDHVERVLHHLGIDDSLWSGKLNYHHMRAESKPHDGAYQRAMAMVRGVVPDIAPHEIIFFDDARPNLVTAKRHGVVTCWVYGRGAAPARKPDDAAYIDHLVDDIREVEQVLAIMRHSTRSQ